MKYENVLEVIDAGTENERVVFTAPDGVKTNVAYWSRDDDNTLKVWMKGDWETCRDLNGKPLRREPKLVPKVVKQKDDYVVIEFGKHRIEVDFPNDYNEEVRVFVDHEKKHGEVLK